MLERESGRGFSCKGFCLPLSTFHNRETTGKIVCHLKTVSDLFLPVSGTVTELNAALSNSPELVNNDPYGEGWMIKMTVENPADVEALLDAAAYEALIN